MFLIDLRERCSPRRVHFYFGKTKKKQLKKKTELEYVEEAVTP